MTKETATMSKVLTILESRKQQACDEILENGPESRNNIPAIAQRDLLIDLKRIFSDKETINVHFLLAVKGKPSSLTISSISEPEKEEIAPKDTANLDNLIARLNSMTIFLSGDNLSTIEQAVKVLKAVKNFVFDTEA